MRLVLRTAFTLVLGAGLLPFAAAQMPDSGWAGEWGQFTFVPASSKRVAYYEGAGLSLTDCTNQRCHFSFDVDAKASYGRVEGDLLIDNEEKAVARLLDSTQKEEKCTLALEKTTGAKPSIIVTPRTGDCSYFLTPGASFEHTYSLRSRTPFYVSDVPQCFVSTERAMTALCTSQSLAAQEWAWELLFYGVDDLSRTKSGYEEMQNKDAERAQMLHSCDSAPDAVGCLAKAFAQSTSDLKARRAAWEDSVTEPGDTYAAQQAIAKIAGSYRHTSPNGDVQGNKFETTDTLEITPVSDTAIHVRVHLFFFNGHECYHDGVASYREAGLFAEHVKGIDGKECVFEVLPTSTGIKLTDPTGMCRMNDCGARGGYGGREFSAGDRIKAVH